MNKNELLFTTGLLESKIFTFRAEQVMVDRDLAELYDVELKRLKEQVKRNLERFPTGYIFQLSDFELGKLVANCDRFRLLKHSSVNPTVFGEQGVAMLSAVLSSKTAIQVSIQIINAFIQMRKVIGSHHQLLHLSEDFAKHKLKTNLKFEQVFKPLETSELINK